MATRNGEWAYGIDRGPDGWYGIAYRGDDAVDTTKNFTTQAAATKAAKALVRATRRLPQPGHRNSAGEWVRS